ncbi:hypothetical protein EYR40_010957 [Pleurotus pulmonarius]|nr:hypothetical protein EYR36_002725 [Pleurotus pulmonarius]KAF4586940.1 hypothetical protein EYR40_010957 [Pleurotus pulmonarius]
MYSSSANNQEAVKAAVMQIRKGGGTRHLNPLVPIVSSKLGSKIKNLFHRNGLRILALKHPLRSVADGLKLYRESTGRACRYVDKAAESNLLEANWNVLRIIFLSSFFVRSFGKFYAAQQSSPNFVPASKALDPSLSAGWYFGITRPSWSPGVNSRHQSTYHAGHGIIPSSNLPSPFTRFLV